MSERDLITPVTERLLLEKRALLRNAEAGALKSYGSVTGGEGGDAEHGEEQYLKLDDYDKAGGRRARFEGAFNTARYAEPPSQHEFVEPNHRVQVYFDADITDDAHVTVVTPINLEVLKDWKVDGKLVFDRKRKELLVSTESPMGSALLGKRSGEIAVYSQTVVKTVYQNKVKVGSIYTANIF